MSHKSSQSLYSGVDVPNSRVYSQISGISKHPTLKSKDVIVCEFKRGGETCLGLAPLHI